MSQSYDEMLLQRAAGAVVVDDSLEARHGAAVDALYAFLTPLQRGFIDDPHRFKLARCGRRAGKTVMDAVYLIIASLRCADTPTLYLGLTQDSAKRAIWPILMFMLDRVDVPFDPKVSGPRIGFDNGSFIQLFGADATNARERLRGQKFALIIVDEMGFFTEGDALVESMLPMLSDYQGTMCMTSSPGYLLSGLFYDADQGKQRDQWRQWYWTMRDNPLFQEPSEDARFETKADEEFFIMAALKFGGDQTHPAFRREWLGEWVKDDENFVYTYGADNIVPDDDHLDRPVYALGIDLGSVSANAVVVLQYSYYSREVRVVEVWKDVGTSIDELGAQILEYQALYDPTFIVADVGGYGKGIVEEVKRRYELPITAADKTDKAFHQRIFANDLRSGYIKVHRDAGLLLYREWDKICKDAAGNEVRGQENHAADACLYVYRKVYTSHLHAYEPELSEEETMIASIEAQARRERLEEADEWYA